MFVFRPPIAIQMRDIAGAVPAQLVLVFSSINSFSWRIIELTFERLTTVSISFEFAKLAKQNKIGFFSQIL